MRFSNEICRYISLISTTVDLWFVSEYFVRPLDLQEKTTYGHCNIFLIMRQTREQQLSVLLWYERGLRGVSSPEIVVGSPQHPLEMRKVHIRD